MLKTIIVIQANVEKINQEKVFIIDHETFKENIIKQNDYLIKKIEDTYNRMVETEIYLDKYLPYNTFVQFMEVMHVSLEKNQLKKLTDFESAKLQNFLAEILLDMGH